VAAALLACGSQPGSRDVVVDDSKKGQTVKVHAGDVVRFNLNRTGWTFNESSAPTVLVELGQVEAADPFTKCYPGMDCGTTTARYKAGATGSATVTATRQSCGEARSCPGAEGLYQVTVVVGA
jgi:hypothetical protein